MNDASAFVTVRFDGLFPKPLFARFDQPYSSSDAGAVLLRAVDERLDLPRALAHALGDARDPNRVRHGLGDVLPQRIFAIACGYEVANDAARLRRDPADKLLLVSRASHLRLFANLGDVPGRWRPAGCRAASAPRGSSG